MHDAIFATRSEENQSLQVRGMLEYLNMPCNEKLKGVLMVEDVVHLIDSWGKLV